MNIGSTACLLPLESNETNRIANTTYIQPTQHVVPQHIVPQHVVPQHVVPQHVGPQTHVITSQPMVTTTTIMTQPQGLQNWGSGICDCCNDMKSCCCTFWCGNFYYACLASRMGENCCVGCSGDPAGCVPGGHMAMRTKLRVKHNIQGDICGDCCMMHCCKPCAMCQIAREMDRQGYMAGSC